MPHLSPLTDAPLSCKGIQVKALYFTSAPGEQYVSVYAQYRNCQTWVPLHIGLPSVPSLQQVRDIDRNIILDSGSYDNAHFYLRSAAGNNMTSAYFTNAAGGGIQVGNVSGYAALQLQPLGGLLNYGGFEVATKKWTQDEGYLKQEIDPVYTASIPNQLMFKAFISASVDLNIYTTTGVFIQTGNANAASGTNYPIARAGKLEVVAGSAGYIWHTYHVYGPDNTVYTRTLYSGTWYPWKQLSTDVALNLQSVTNNGNTTTNNIILNQSSVIKITPPAVLQRIVKNPVEYYSPGSTAPVGIIAFKHATTAAPATMFDFKIIVVR